MFCRGRYKNSGDWLIDWLTRSLYLYRMASCQLCQLMSVTDVQIGGEVSFVSQREDGRSDVLTPSQSEQQGWRIVFF